ncbi:MAG: iron-sulfur cluster assembly accessory protein [Chlamydiia bacterium]|nr:iron-sulfur cluster assembly accessory protein [Chlamydiia bacterium]
MTQQIEITKNMTISTILESFPHQSQRLAQLITNAGLHCVGCGASSFETLEEGMLGHGKSQQQIEDLVKKLNVLLEEKFDIETISITKRAAEKFRFFAEEEGKKGCALRFGLMKGGCSGFEYILDYSEAPCEEDEIFESEGLCIHVKKDHAERLLGCMIDYVDGLSGAGFKISNPNVRSSCGCGRSQKY